MTFYHRAGKFLYRQVAPLYAVIFALQSSAQIITLNDANTQLQINPATKAGVFRWSVDGQDILARQWFWLRVGTSGPERMISDISAPTLLNLGAKSLDASYSNGSMAITASFILNGQAPGSGISGMAELFHVVNLTTTPLDFHFFECTDLNLPGGNDQVRLAKNPFTDLYTIADQLGANGGFSEAVLTPGANHAEAGLFPDTFSRLTDNLPTTLNDASASGPGDAMWAFEWDMTIPPGGSFDINTAMHVTTTVPEPGTGTFILMGACAFVMFRRLKPAR